MADPAEGKDRLGEHSSGEQPPDLEADDRGDRQHRVAQHVAPADGPRGQALGFRGADIVLVEHIEDRGPGDPEDHREGDGGERHRWKHQVEQRVTGGVPLAGEQAVQHEEPGDSGGLEAGILPPGHREKLPLDGEEVLEHEGGEEDRHSDADQRHHDRAVVQDRTAAAGSEVAERDA